MLAIRDKEEQVYSVVLGYWREGIRKNKNVELPFPTANKIDSKIVKQFEEYCELISAKQCKTLGYKGSSTCRICGCSNGSEEQRFRFKSKSGDIILLSMPEGYFHYVKNHGVRPPMQFLECLAKKKYRKAISYLRPMANVDKNGDRIVPSVDRDTVYLISEETA